MSFTFFFILVIALTLLSYLLYRYFERVRQLRHQLISMGVAGDKLNTYSAFFLPYLKDLLYEKETELTEQNYVATSKAQNN